MFCVTSKALKEVFLHPAFFLFFVFFLISFYLFYFLASLQAMWDLSSPTKDQTCGPCNGSADSKPLDLQESPQSLSYIDSSLFHILIG